MFPGDHFFLQTEEHLVRRRISQHLWKTNLRSDGIDGEAYPRVSV
jgi:surfactin synthase thioesterase subunit